MKKIALAAAFSLAATSAFAGTLADPIIEEPVIVEETSGLRIYWGTDTGLSKNATRVGPIAGSNTYVSPGTPKVRAVDMLQTSWRFVHMQMYYPHLPTLLAHTR